MGNLVSKNRRRYGNHCSMLQATGSLEVDTVGLFHSAGLDDSSCISTHHQHQHQQQDLSIFTLDRRCHDIICTTDHSPVTVESPATPLPCDVTPLDSRFRYHLFFTHHDRDKGWVEWAVGRLESPPYGCHCCLEGRDFDPRANRLQNMLCSAMLSRRMVFVVSTAFLENCWRDLEEGLTQLVFHGQGRHRIISVILDDCVGVIPDLLRLELLVDARHEPHSETILQTLFADGVSYSQSTNTIRSLSLQSTVDYNNGQLIADVSSTIEGFCRPRISFNIDDIPDNLSNSDSALSRSDYQQIINCVSRTEEGVQAVSWLFSATPSALLILLFVLWCISFILIILLFPDDYPSTLPVRLSVFCLPAVAIVLGCVARWRRLKQLKEEYASQMFESTLRINRLLFSRGRPLLVTAGRTREDHFHIYFVCFDLTKCLERTRLYLTYCTQEDIEKLSKLIAFYTFSSEAIEISSVPEQLLVMMCSSYALALVLQRVPHSLEQRHTRRRQCLCQFLEEFLVAYLSWTRRETNPVYVRHVFHKYLNRRVRTDTVTLQRLGITVIET